MKYGKPTKVFTQDTKTSDENIEKSTPTGEPEAIEKAHRPGADSVLPGSSRSAFLPGDLFGTPPLRPRRLSATSEPGYPGLHIYGGYVTEEFITQLRDYRGVQIYEEMRRNDPIVGSMLLAAEQMIHNASVLVEPSVQDPESQESQKAAELVKTSLHDMGNTWTDTLSEILTFLAFGWSYCAVWHKKREGYNMNQWKSSKYNDGDYGWAGISLRGQSTLESWETDHKGHVTGMIQQGPPTYELVRIPLGNAGHFRTRTEKDNPEGVSILRNAWRPWWIKRNLEEVEGIGVERDVAGLPILKVPEGIDIWNSKNPDAAATLERANNIVRLIRVDKYAGLVLPYGWELDLITTPGQRAQNTDKIINRWDQRIAVTLLADMLLIGHESVGSFALVQSKTRLFSSALESYAARIAGVFNRSLIPRLMKLNGIPEKHWPTMRFGPVDAPALTELAMFMKTLHEIGIKIDEPTGRYLLDAANLPEPKRGENAVKTFEEDLEEQTKRMEVAAKLSQDGKITAAGKGDTNPAEEAGARVNARPPQEGGGTKPEKKPGPTGSPKGSRGGNPRGGNQKGQTPPSKKAMRKAE